MNIILSNEFCSVSINTKGAELNSIKNSQTKTEYIWNGNPDFWGKHSPVLFPIVGALKDDCYFYEGKKYNLSRHGFARDFEFEVIESSSNAASFLLKQNSEIVKKYPPLNLDIDSNELLDKYFTDVEKTTNGLLTPSKLIGTLLALCSNDFKNPKITRDIAEKLLK